MHLYMKHINILNMKYVFTCQKREFYRNRKILILNVLMYLKEDLA